MTETETNPLHFIPIGRVIADPIDLPTAQTMAIFGRRSADTDLFQDANGDFVFRMLNPRTGEREYCRPGDDHSGGQEFVIMLVHGRAVVGEAMRNGDLEAFVIGKDGQYLRVPRFYWIKADPSTTTTLEQIETGHVPSELVNLPLLVDPAEIPNWTAIVRPAVEAMVSKTRAARGEEIVQLRPAKGPRGPDPYKEYPMLEAIFKAHDAKLSDMRSARARHDYLKKIWLGIYTTGKVQRESCPAYAVVTRCWDRFKA